MQGTISLGSVSNDGMDLNRLRLIVAPALASLFLILSLCAFVVQRPASEGMLLPMLKVRPVPFKDCDFVSDRSIIAQLHKDGGTWINETRENPDKFGPTLTEIYGTREEREIYVFSEPDVSFGEFANFFNTVASSTSDLHIGLQTRQLQAQIHECPPGSYCELAWHDRTYIPCVWANIPVYIPRHSLR